MTIDSSSLPRDREGRDAWLAERETAISTATTKALRAIIVAAYEAFLGTLTASAYDLAPLDEIPDAWMTFVHRTLVDDLGEVYQAGQVTAWLGLANVPSRRFAEAWTAVANHNAESYAAQATNRLRGVGDATWRMVRDQVHNAIRDGVSTEDLKGKIEDITRFSEFRADTIARTETVGAYVQGDMAGARALGDSGPVEKVWVATSDRRTRPSHAEAHDQCVPFDQPFSVGGVSMDAPHDPSAPAGEVVNCRCICEMLYAGDTRPDGSTIEATVAIPEHPAVDVPEALAPSEAAQWFRDAAARTLAGDDRSAAYVARSDYIGGSHTRINADLRAGIVTDAARAVDAAIDQIGVQIAENVQLFRGAIVDGDLSVGDVIRDPAFMSVSTNEQVSAGFAGYDDNAVLFRIIDHGTVRGLPASQFEQELILHRGANLNVLDVRDNPLGGRIVDVRLS